jgi:hypothetical protein
MNMVSATAAQSSRNLLFVKFATDMRLAVSRLLISLASF